MFFITHRIDKVSTPELNICDHFSHNHKDVINIWPLIDTIHISSVQIILSTKTRWESGSIPTDACKIRIWFRVSTLEMINYIKLCFKFLNNYMTSDN